ncbi:MAG: hypothetical protein GY804_09940 [Alphaproteobacteria bacterium]|nr:hypothetical protein [Alphaproteobacteria bacterium]
MKGKVILHWNSGWKETHPIGTRLDNIQHESNPRTKPNAYELNLAGEFTDLKDLEKFIKWLEHLNSVIEWHT